MPALVEIIVVRAHVPRMTLDELFEQKGDVAKAVLEELEKVFITSILVTSILLSVLGTVQFSSKYISLLAI